ncbi:hypothetical protein LSTR_LSTR001623 [Laodelphax striatellus]|uniref:Aldehyde dehydrogenase domain-containing protein n=1 Tax=Laodelphax striatellus TaxID=195883 RepID=A0A482XCG5_LAOST|nr:hypothetical protein LSTR_LSTR001623 [Laodelphax striatellus]
MDGEVSSSKLVGRDRLKREKISEIHRAMDYKSEGNFSDAWEWLGLNLNWINAVLLNRHLEVKHGNFSIAVLEMTKKIPSETFIDQLPCEKLISASESLITLFEEHSDLFGKLACLKVNWELGFFMNNDVKYLKDYLKIFSIYRKNPTFYLPTIINNKSYRSNDEIDSVYNLPVLILASCFSRNPTTLLVSEDFLLPTVLFLKLMSQAGFQDNVSLMVEKTIPIIEEGIMLVFGDGDVDSAIDTLIDNYLYGPKQGMWLMKKVLIQETVYDNFIERLLKQIDRIALPPLHYYDNGEEDSYKELILDAKSVGIKVHETFSKNGVRGPIIFKGEPPSCVALNQTHLQLPFIATQSFRTAEECATLANNNVHCSNASLWTESQSLAMKVHNLLKMNIVWLNAHGLMDPLVPVYCSNKGRYFSSIDCDVLFINMFGTNHISVWRDYNCSNQTIQKALKEWQKFDSLQRANILSDIAHNFRQRLVIPTDCIITTWPLDVSLLID